MGLFNRNKRIYPEFPKGDYEPVLKCSICNGEQVICARENGSGKIHELMLMRSPAELEAYCEENGLAASEIRKIY